MQSKLVDNARMVIARAGIEWNEWWVGHWLRVPYLCPLARRVRKYVFYCTYVLGLRLFCFLRNRQ